MSDFLKDMADSIAAENPAPAPAPEGSGAPEEGLTVEKISGMIEKALKSNDEKTRSIMQEVIDANLEKLATYKPEEKPAEKPKEEDLENG